MNNILNKKIVKIVVAVIILLILDFAIFYGVANLMYYRLEYERKMRYTPSGRVYKKYEKLDKNHLYVVTKSEYNGDISYYKVDKKLRLSEANKFDYEPLNALELSGCFNSYTDREENEELNKLDKKNCKIIDSENNKVSSNKDIDNIIKLVSKTPHVIVFTKIIPINGDYYVVTLLNVNYWSPYTLYKYEDNTLKRIYRFDGENVIALKTFNY